MANIEQLCVIMRQKMCHVGLIDRLWVMLAHNTHKIYCLPCANVHGLFINNKYGQRILREQSVPSICFLNSTVWWGTWRSTEWWNQTRLDETIPITLPSFQLFPFGDRIWFQVFFKYPLCPSFKWAELTLTSLSHQSNSATNSNSPFLKHGNRDCVFFF